MSMLVGEGQLTKLFMIFIIYVVAILL